MCGVELSRQRLAINGVFAEHEAIAALVFHHKGHPVTVSSGLTAEQRIKWAEDPNLIVSSPCHVRPALPHAIHRLTHVARLADRSPSSISQSPRRSAERVSRVSGFRESNMYGPTSGTCENEQPPQLRYGCLGSRRGPGVSRLVSLARTHVNACNSQLLKGGQSYRQFHQGETSVAIGYHGSWPVVALRSRSTSPSLRTPPGHLCCSSQRAASRAKRVASKDLWVAQLASVLCMYGGKIDVALLRNIRAI